MGGAGAAALTQPFDVVKTRMQTHQMVLTDKRGYRKVTIPRVSRTFKEVFNIGGVRALWTGGLARCTRAGVAGIVLGPIFEFVCRVAEDMDKPFRKLYIPPPDPSSTIVHPRSEKAMYIEVK